MAVLSDLEPKKVFHYFEEICGIPHGSRNTKKISDYLVGFAKERKLKYIQDENNNVIIFKDGTKGYESSLSLIIQGHMDMVCEKEADCGIDFEKDGLSLAKTDKYIYAKGTTLGGDDGIAVAYALEILDSDDIAHPPLEVVITVDEEIGMLGAAALDTSSLSSKLMLNLDSEDEGQLLVSCAGGATVGLKYTAPCQVVKPVNERLAKGYLDDDDYIRMRLDVSGITGGHSGIEIDKQGANANKILGRALYALNKTEDIYINLVELGGGLKDNAIPREAYAVFDVYVEEESNEHIDFISKIIKDKVRSLNEILKNEYSVTDSDIRLDVEEVLFDVNSDEDIFNLYADYKNPTEDIIAILMNLPNGVRKMSNDIEDLVQTSLNLGILKTEETAMNREIEFTFSVRSSVRSEKEELIDILESLIRVFDGEISISGDYPAWEYKKASKLRDVMSDAYLDLFGERPETLAVHAGLECGIFAGKIENLDCVSIGPKMEGIHTTNEKLYIESVRRYWDYILEILKRLK
ncbi:MAG: aminoacyl-histidine dipeptidase [Lachnospiraceae bacterium]|nr:aminoacyl-histidine dipeptidase [Lachnospiraceae bacterium]